MDAIWEHFERLPSNKSKCRVCGHEAAANPERMKKHHAKHADSENRPPPAKQPRITDFTVSTSKDDKNKFDILVGRFFFENNIAFNIVESTSFKELCHALHPGYKPPNRKILGNEILDTVHTQLESKCSKKLNGKEVTLCIDGWSNTCNDPMNLLAGDLVPTSILHTCAGRRLTPKELKDAKKLVEEKYTSLLPVYVDFVAEGKTVFMENWAPASGCKVENFIKLSRDEQEISQGLAELMITMLKLIPSTAGLERVFSTMGFVHSDLRNRLGSEKVTKLAFCLRSLKSQAN